MRMVLVVHIMGGGLGLVAGYVALSARKGARLHRRGGLVFVVAILAMALTGALIAGLTGVESSVLAGLVTAYLVVTGLTTIRPPSAWSRRVDGGALAVALVLGLASVGMGVHLLATGGTWDGLPAFPYFVLGLPALLGGLSDIRVMRSGPLAGAARLARHLWRMCYALLITAMSFFFGQAQVIPEPVRIPALLAFPVLVVVVAMLYWIWRVRIRRSLRGIAVAGAPGAAQTVPID